MNEGRITRFDITTDSYEPGTKPNWDIIEVYGQCLKKYNHIRVTVPVHKKEDWERYEEVAGFMKAYTLSNPEDIKLLRLSTMDLYQKKHKRGDLVVVTKGTEEDTLRIFDDIHEKLLNYLRNGYYRDNGKLLGEDEVVDDGREE